MPMTPLTTPPKPSWPVFVRNLGQASVWLELARLDPHLALAGTVIGAMPTHEGHGSNG